MRLDKAEGNVKKHAVSFEIAQSIFDDPFHLSVLDSRHPDEERWVTIGQSVHDKTLVVAHAYCVIKNGQELVRIISARKATKKEKRQYEEGI